MLAIGLFVATASSAETPDSTSRDDETQTFSGRIYSKGASGATPLFLLKRTATRSGSTLTALREFTYPDGKPAARERIVYEGNELVSYELEELQTCGHGTTRIRKDPSRSSKRIVFEYSPDAKSKSKSSEEPLRNDTLVGDMVGPFLAANWDKLIRGETVKCRYIVVPRRETVGFSFTKESESTWHGQPVVNIKMEASSVIIAALVDPLHFAVQKDGHHYVLECAGRTTPKIQSGNKWNDLDAVTVFEWN